MTAAAKRRRQRWVNERAARRMARDQHKPCALMLVRQMIADQEARGLYDDCQPRSSRGRAGALVLALLATGLLVLCALAVAAQSGRAARAAQECAWDDADHDARTCALCRGVYGGGGSGL